MSVSLLIADVVTKESAGAAGMVGVLMGLIGLIRLLINQRSEKKKQENGNAFATKGYVRELFVEFKNPSQQEKMNRDRTRVELHELHGMAIDEKADRKDIAKDATETNRRMREIGDSLRRIEKSSSKALEIAMVDEKQNAILEELRRISSKLGKRSTR